MLYRREDGRTLAISQPAHAWISGQLLAGLAEPPSEPLRLAAEIHDIAWLDWEARPDFDPATGRPPSFREVGARIHAPMWIAGVERALANYGPHAALMISRHGARIYRRFGLPHAGPEDAAAIRAYLDAQAPREAEWAAACGLDAGELERQSTLIAFADALSLAVCGDLRLPVTLDLPQGPVEARAAGAFDLRLSPWPFAGGAFVVEGQGRAMPAGGRFADKAEMRVWLASPQREAFRTRLAPG